MRVTDNCLQWLETCLAGERVESDHAVATGFAFAIETVVNERPDRNEHAGGVTQPRLVEAATLEAGESFGIECDPPA